MEPPTADVLIVPQYKDNTFPPFMQIKKTD